MFNECSCPLLPVQAEQDIPLFSLLAKTAPPVRQYWLILWIPTSQDCSPHKPGRFSSSVLWDCPKSIL